MHFRKYHALWIALFLVLIDCALTYADDWSFGRSRRYSSGASSGPLDVSGLALGSAVVFGVFALTSLALFFLHTWLLTSLVAVKVMTILGFFSFFAWPLFVLCLFPPLFIFAAISELYTTSVGHDPYGSVYLLIIALLASCLYFYLAYMVLGAFSAQKEWERTTTRFLAVLAIPIGIFSLLAGNGFYPLLFFALCASTAWIAGKAYKKTKTRTFVAK